MDNCIESAKYREFSSKRNRLADAVDDRKKAEAMRLEFVNERLRIIDSIIDKINLVKDFLSRDNSKREIFNIIFSPLNSVLIESSYHKYHVMSDSINLDLGIWKLVSEGQWDELEKLHRNTLEEMCPEPFKSRLNSLWESGQSP